MQGPIPNQETVFFYLDRMDEEKTFSLRIDPTTSFPNLKEKIAEKVANILGGVSAADLEENLEVSDGATVIGEDGCNSIADLRQIEHKEGAGKRDITAISVRILSDDS